MTDLLSADEIAREIEGSVFCGFALAEYIPPVWDGPHVGKRMIEAFGTLRRMPWNWGPAQFGTVWPGYAYEWYDRNAQQQADGDQKDHDAAVRNRVRTMPSASDITRMEAAIGWAGRYLAEIAGLSRLTQCVALYRAAERESEWIARRLGLHPSTMRRRNRQGLDLIAGGLRRDQIEVF